MKVLSFGSYNIDESYEVEHFVRPGETLKALKASRHLGGKGFNQTMALHKAGVTVLPAGAIGEDGQIFLEAMKDLDLSLLKKISGPTGHAFIQLCQGENSIIINPGANNSITEDQIHRAIATCFPGDYLLIQNEINNLAPLIHEAHLRRMKVVFNAAPMHEDVLSLPLADVDLLIVNETEASMLVDTSDHLIEALQKRFPHKEILLTLGEEGSVYLFEDVMIKQKSMPTQVVDTTGAGDTYIGFFLAALINGVDIKEAMKQASYASSIAISRFGAAESIPSIKEVHTAMVKDQLHHLPIFAGQTITYKKGRFNQDLPVFDEATKAYVYAFYQSGLLKWYDEDNASFIKKDITALDLLETVKLLAYYIRQGSLKKDLFAQAIQDGTIKALDNHLHTFL